MCFTLEEDAWNWTATEWIVRLRIENQYVESWYSGWDIDTPSEAELAAQTPVWKLIARYMYQMDIDARLSNSPA
jgi:hypothetical protein